MTTYRDEFLSIVGETKRMWLVAVPGRKLPVRVLKSLEFRIMRGCCKVMVVDDQVAAFVGLEKGEQE